MRLYCSVPWDLTSRQAESQKIDSLSQGSLQFQLIGGLGFYYLGNVSTLHRFTDRGGCLVEPLDAIGERRRVFDADHGTVLLNQRQRKFEPAGIYVELVPDRSFYASHSKIISVQANVHVLRHRPHGGLFVEQV